MFTKSGEFQVPDGIEEVRAIAVGGGGGGAYHDDGGGGAGYVGAGILKVLPWTTYQVTVGGAGGGGGGRHWGGGPCRKPRRIV